MPRRSSATFVYEQMDQGHTKASEHIFQGRVAWLSSGPGRMMPKREIEMRLPPHDLDVPTPPQLSHPPMRMPRHPRYCCRITVAAVSPGGTALGFLAVANRNEPGHGRGAATTRELQ
ncbi:hypothetical protein N658DRAFT_241847 [Parathielavia hyrcaniae]|uniref:Uncharacterized protein n=1 Tax=Parathielavia hyrcaniae TaxID=113614 RepID=A0AAN6Q5R4_9PEZI|nr:hypothetical protein N658DRAFT_241847 [Parathielavia hyrcaniae]